VGGKNRNWKNGGPEIEGVPNACRGWQRKTKTARKNREWEMPKDLYYQKRDGGPE